MDAHCYALSWLNDYHDLKFIALNIEIVLDSFRINYSPFWIVGKTN